MQLDAKARECVNGRDKYRVKPTVEYSGLALDLKITFLKPTETMADKAFGPMSANGNR